MPSCDITTGTGSSLCPWFMHGVEWSAEITTAVLDVSLPSSSLAKNRLSISSMFSFFPTASPSCPNSSGPLMWTYIAFWVSMASEATLAFSS